MGATWANLLFLPHFPLMQEVYYTALLSGKASGQYQVKVNADIKGEKVNGRFTFKK